MTIYRTNYNRLPQKQLAQKQLEEEDQKGEEEETNPTLLARSFTQ